MTAVFMKVLNMSMTAGWLILAVILIRLMLRRSVPKWIFPILWVIVGVRLVMPVSIESSFSLIPETATVQQDSVGSGTVVISGGDSAAAEDDAGISETASSVKSSALDASESSSLVNTDSAKSSAIDDSGSTSSANTDSAENPSANTSGSAPLTNTGSANEADLGLSISVQKKEIKLSSNLFTVFSAIWIAGMILILVYGLISYFQLARRMKTAVRLRENIYQSEWAKSPFLLGMIRPRIYIPWHLSESSEEHSSNSESDRMEYVIAHEQAHIHRGDHWAKPIGFVLLAIHWFNPLVWAAYVLFCRDIEYACDEAVIRHLDVAQRTDYSETLLNCRISQHRLVACPIAFGETSVKTRIKNILNYRKPALWVIVFAVLLCAVLAVCFLTDPVSGNHATGAETEAETNTETDEGSDLNQIIRLEDSYIAEAELTGEMLDGIDVSSDVQSFYDDAAGIIRGEDGYEKLHDQFVEYLSNFVENEEDNDWVITGESRVYVSLVPMLEWDVEECEVLGATVLVFTEDLQGMFAFELFYQDNGSCSWGTMGDFSESKLQQIFMENPGKEYLHILDGNVAFWINEECENVYGDDEADEITVSGDYYEKLCEFGLGNSCEKLTAEENLVAFDF